MTQNIQVAPYPAELAALVAETSYRAHERWSVRLENDYPRDDDSEGNTIGLGVTLIICTRGYDSYHPENGPHYGVMHFFIVPAATYNREAWQRWLFERFVDVETHEAMEHFVVAGERPFAPLHGPGMNPYTVHQVATDIERRTRPNGAVVA